MNEILTSWWFFGLLVIAVGVGLRLMLRSYGRWRPYGKPEDAQAKDAESELWSKHNMDQR